VAQALQVEQQDRGPLAGWQCRDGIADAPGQVRDLRELGRTGGIGGQVTGRQANALRPQLTRQRRATLSAIPQNQAPNRSGERSRSRPVIALTVAS